jgi:hypothetical protein
LAGDTSAAHRVISGPFCTLHAAFAVATIATRKRRTEAVRTAGHIRQCLARDRGIGEVSMHKYVPGDDSPNK